MMNLGIYESLITETLKSRLDTIDRNEFYIADQKKLDADEAVHFLAMHLGGAIKSALKLIKAEKKDLLVSKQIEITNNVLKYLTQEISNYEFTEDLIFAEGLILEGVLDKLNSNYSDVKLHLSEIMPLTRLTQSELFTGGNVGLSLDAELKKEVRSSDRIDLLVSFIKWKAIVILRDAFEEFTKRGGKLRIITTTYMGATDAKAINELSKLPNTEVKVSYNNSNERLHAKAYLFFRNSGFHTGYIGSSNFSRSALTDGLEWNVKVTTKEIPHIIDKFQKTFESYWNNPEFELYDETKLQLLDDALQNNKMGKATLEVVRFFDLKPYHYQSEILEKLKVERTVHDSHKNLIVAATGTGKTMIAAFDFKKYLAENPNAKFLFVAHRIEILKQALHTFRNVLKDQNFGELYGNGYEPKYKNTVFATVQTLGNLDFATYSTKDYFDYIILDEAHHGQASSYQKIINYFEPQILLGLTATPERMDGKSILPDFNNKIAAEIRLPDALNNKLLCPFQYFGISDSVDYSRVKWNNGKYDPSELTNIYTANDIRIGDIIKNLDDYTKDIHSVSAIGFCVSIDHAKFMKRKFEAAGLAAEFLVSDNSKNREEILHQLTSKKINYLFVVDIFNEGVDIPQIDTVLFLRPTESLTIFLQQLGRGLRLSEGKDVLTVLDFVGQARDEYDFENKFRALIGKTNTTVLKEIEQDFPHLPLGCSIVLEKKAKHIILENIRKATSINKRQLVLKIQRFQLDTNLELNLSNFVTFYNLRLQQIYKNFTFSELLEEALRTPFNRHLYANYKSMLSNKLIATESLSYFKFIMELIQQNFDLAKLPQSDNTNLLATMVFYDFFQSASKEMTLEEGIRKIGENKDMVKELQEFISLKIELINYEEFPLEDLSFSFPLKLHSRYTREQIMVAMRLTTVGRRDSGVSGVAENKFLNCEALFVNLKKSEEDFSPTTMYDDFAINEFLFHWQSQNQTADTSEKGKSYIQQQERNKIILLFVRESKTDADGFTKGYVFVGPVNFVESTGSKPMSITWKLEKEMPHFLWQESAKLSVG